jgi:prepilin-type N-terminal cleavage/methylation domain-containing protein
MIADSGRRAPLRTRPAFTLVELLVVVAVIGILLALLLPAVQAARESGRRTQCKEHLHQVGLAFLNFESANKKFPPGKKWSRPRNDPQTFDYAWSSILLDYVEEQALHDLIDFNLPLTSPTNLPATSQAIPIYLCPSTDRVEAHRSPDGKLFNLGGVPGEGLGCIDYLGVSGPDKDTLHPATGEEYGRQRGVLLGTKGLPNGNSLVEPPAITVAKITDGLSKTICMVECTGRGVTMKDGVVENLNGAWASGSNISHINKSVNAEEPPDVWEGERIFAEHPGGAHALVCDGSVHFLSEDVAELVIMYLCSRDGGEVVNEMPF